MGAPQAHPTKLPIHNSSLDDRRGGWEESGESCSGAVGESARSLVVICLLGSCLWEKILLHVHIGITWQTFEKY